MEKMCEEALDKGDPSKVKCWFDDSVIRYDVGNGMESDEHPDSNVDTDQQI